MRTLSQPGLFYFLNDHLGTPQKIVDSTGQVVWAAAYLPFGKAQVTTETVANNLRFPGQYSDAESGLHYNWHRYYDPETGRYITADPIGLAGGINLYAYVLNNPVNGTDPTGRLAPVVIGIIAGGVGGFITGYVGSGGDMMATLKSVVLGAAAGGLAAFVIGAPLVEIVANSNLSLGTGMVAVSAINSVSAGVASAIGQIFGNWANLDPATKNFNQGAVKGAALGGAATVFSSIAGILPELEGSTLWGILQGIYEGSLVGQGELAGGIIENEEKKHPCLNR